MAISVQASVSAGAYTTGKVVVIASDTVQFRVNPQFASGVWAVLWEIYEAPTGFTTPAGWAAAASGLSWYFVATASTSLMPPLVTLGALWGKYLVRATANNGTIGGVVTDDAIDDSCCLSMLSPTGLEGLAALEEDQSFVRGAMEVVKRAIEALEPLADAAMYLRTGYDISVASTSVPNDGLGTGYATILDTTRATLFSATQRHRDIAIVFTVRDYAAAPTDPIDTVFATIVFTRRDSTADTLVTDEGTVDSSTPASITGTITLPAIGQTMGYRFRCGSGGTATHVYLEILRDVAEDRYVSAKIYLGPEETIA